MADQRGASLPPVAKTIENEVPPAVTTSAPAVAPTVDAKKPKKAPVLKVPFRSLFRYATPFDRALNCIAAIAATANGFIFPGFALLFGA